MALSGLPQPGYHSRMNLEFSDEALVDLGRQALAVEIDGLRAQVPRLGPQFARACRICLDCRGRIVVTGMGKSGHIGGKIAATLASTGTPAFFVHPGEASHGDVGMITRDDAVLALSNSGETEEILTIVPVIARLGETARFEQRHGQGIAHGQGSRGAGGGGQIERTCLGGHPNVKMHGRGPRERRV